MSEEAHSSPPEETPDAGSGKESRRDRATFDIGRIEGQIVNPGGNMSFGDVTLNAAFDHATMNIQSRLQSAVQDAEQVTQGADEERAELVHMVRDLRAELERAEEQHQAEVLKVAKRLEALVSELKEPKPDTEMVSITGEGLKRAAANLAEVMPTVLQIATQIVAHAGVLVR